MRNLCILPPLQKDTNKTTNNHTAATNSIVKDAILLPPILPSEPVSAIRGALAEIRGYAHITNYRLVLEDIDDDVHEAILAYSKKILLEDEKIKVTNDASIMKKLENGNASNAGKKKKKKGGNSSAGGAGASSSVSDLVSPYTCMNAAIKVPTSNLSLNEDPNLENKMEDETKEQVEIVLNDFGDLSSYVENNELESNMGLRMVLERYDLGLVKDHVLKTRFILDGNVPCVLRVVGDNIEDGEGVQQKEKDGGTNGESDKSNDNPDDVTPDKGKDDAAEMTLCDFPLNKPVSVNGSNLKDFFYLTCGEEERLKILDGDELSDLIDLRKNVDDDDDSGKKNVKSSIVEAQNVALRWSELDDLCHIRCTISFGGFNPPPTHRRLVGDLAYLEVELPGNEGKINITAIPTGFYVNRSSGKKFDPSPAVESCFSHELLDCLLQKSNSLRHAWVSFSKSSLLSYFFYFIFSQSHFLAV